MKRKGKSRVKQNNEKTKINKNKKINLEMDKTDILKMNKKNQMIEFGIFL